MQREIQNKQNKSGEEKKEGYIIVPNYFLREWVSILGVGPIVLYQELLTYCHKGKYIAWPTLDSLCQEMGIAKTTLLRYQNTLIKFGLVKNISRAKSTTGHYRNNIYQITPLEEIPDYRDIRDIRYQNDTNISSKMIPDRFQNDTSIGSNMKLSLVSKRYPNNTNLNITNITAATKREKDAVAAVVNFKKLKEKGDLSAYGHAQAEEKIQSPYSSKEHYTGQAVREQMMELDFKEGFIEKILKEYSTKKIEEKLELLMERRNIQNPVGWLMAALKNDYRGEEPSMSSSISPLSFPRRRESSECHDESKMDSHFHGNDIIPNVIVNDHKERSNPKHVNLNSQIPSPPEGEGDKILSSEEAARRFHLLRQKLMTMESPLARNVGARCIEPGITERMSTCACTHADRNPPPTFPSPLGGRGSG